VSTDVSTAGRTHNRNIYCLRYGFFDGGGTVVAQLTSKYLSEGISTVRYSVVVGWKPARCSTAWHHVRALPDCEGLVSRGVVGLTSERPRPAPCWTAPAALERECNYRRQTATEERTTEWTMHIGGLLDTSTADTIRLRMQCGNGGRELTADLAYTIKIRPLSW